jgi:Xaa-Pro aminopeptidase
MDIEQFLEQEWLDAYLMHTNSTQSSDMYYTSRFLAGDAFTYLNSGHEVLMVSSMEKGRAEKESRIMDIRSSSDYGLKEEAKTHKDSGEAYCRVLARLLKGEGLHKVAVPRDFPVFYADCLERAGFQITCVKSPIMIQREKKTTSEIQAITTAQHACEQAVAKAAGVVRKADIVNGELMMNGKILTSEDVRAIIHHSLLDMGCEADGTIVACGPRSADPHWQGQGTLMPDQPIVLDVFPRHTALRYYSDMSRTVVKGEPDPTIMEMHKTVLTAMETAFDLIGPGVNGSEVHQAVCDTITDAGFHVGDDEGFIHSTGHGVGLDVHEGPGLGLQDVVLEKGNVVTVEPGLYYRDAGGVRVEDMVVVTASGCKNLTTFDKNLRI